MNDEVGAVNDERVAAIARALAHPARVRIVRLLADQSECRGHEVFGELPLAQSTVSEHLRVLRDAGVVDSHPVGTAMVYCLNGSALLELSRALDDLGARTASCADEKEGGSRG